LFISVSVVCALTLLSEQQKIQPGVKECWHDTFQSSLFTLESSYCLYIYIYIYIRLSHRSSVRSSVCLSVRHTGGSIKNGAR